MQIYTSSEMMIPRNLKQDPVNRPRKISEISFLAKSATWDSVRWDERSEIQVFMEWSGSDLPTKVPEIDR